MRHHPIPDHDEKEDVWSDWRWQLRRGIRSGDELAQQGFISPEEAIALNLRGQRYKILITPYYLSLIDRSDPGCPIRLQSIPTVQEYEQVTSERVDPIGDHAHAPTEILVHRYPDRALLFPTFECPMYCRYCFRKETLNQASIRLHSALPESLDYLTQHPEIEELILSGGDPLMLPDERLYTLFKALDDTPIQRLRIHTRVPVTLPQRITHPLAELFEQIGRHRPLTLITHFNHPKELSPEAIIGLNRLRKAGITLLNQSVLLHRVNDDVTTLVTLSKSLHQAGVLPYYLHHPDLIVGTQHLRRSLRAGRELFQTLRGHLSGYLIPRYVIDIPGGAGKIEVMSEAVQAGDNEGEWWLRSPIDGSLHAYHDPAAQQERR